MNVIELKITSRDDLIFLGRTIGEHLKDKHRWGGQSIITAHGAVDCGKSVLALAIDQVIRPDVYEDGLTQDKSVDKLLSKHPARPCPPVVFKNFEGNFYSTVEGFNNELFEHLKRHRQAKVLFASNISLQMKDSFLLASEGLEKSHVDIDMEFDTNPNNPFDSQIRTIVRDEQLKQKLSLSGLEITP